MQTDLTVDLCAPSFLDGGIIDDDIRQLQSSQIESLAGGGAGEDALLILGAEFF